MFPLDVRELDKFLKALPIYCTFFQYKHHGAGLDLSRRLLEHKH